MKFTLTDKYDEAPTRLFKIGDDGRVTIGSATTCEPGTQVDLEKWAHFSDYIMEGFVTYNLRLSRQNGGGRFSRFVSLERIEIDTSLSPSRTTSNGLGWKLSKVET